MTPEEQRISKEKSKLREIYDCLMFSQCQIQYAKYGNYVPLEQMGQISIDIRTGQQFLFYIMFSLVTGALSNPKQTRGISFSRAIGIVFLFNEIEQLYAYQHKIEKYGASESEEANSQNINDLNKRIEFIDSFFKPTFCVFEKIVLQRYIYFLIFNISCTLSEAFYKDALEGKSDQMDVCEKNQKQIEDLVKQLYKKQAGEEFSRKPYSSTSMPMKKIFMDVSRELHIEVNSIKQGISHEKAKQKAKIWGYLKRIPALIFFYFLFKNQIWPFAKPFVRDYLPQKY